MDRKEFEALLKNGETEWLEWKENFPPGLVQGSRSPCWEKGKAELLKDLVSLANSFGQSSAYLVYGVKDLRIRRDIKGISKSFDGSIFQQWSKNTFEPPPKFRYDTLEYRPSQIIGIFQIEKISDYPHIVKTTVGDILHKGQVWFRTGSQNGVALYPELKKIFLGEKPVQFTTLNEVQDIRKVYEENGDEIQFVLLEQEEQRLLEGYKIAAYPGTRQKIVVGSGRAELAMLIKPKKE